MISMTASRLTIEPSDLQAPRSLAHPLTIPDTARAEVLALMESGKLHRYAEAGGSSESYAARLEREMARLLGRRYAVAVNSCGSALFLSLLGAGVRPGDPVLLNAFTLGPVPGAVVHAGARPIAIGITDDLVIDCADLEAKALQTGARHLLLSHMRGHVSDMTQVMCLAGRLGLTVIEDCAHTLGASWAGTPTGGFGIASCFSTQSGKHVNSGEGGVLVTDDPDIAARAILHSGSYMLFAQNGACPPADVMDRWANRCANFSLRLGEINAALALSQLPLLPERIRRWNDAHDRIALALARVQGIRLPQRPQQEAYVQSSLQFSLPSATRPQIEDIVNRCRNRGVFLKWFGMAEPEGYTSTPKHWAHVSEEDRSISPATERVLSSLLDFRLSTELTADDCETVAAIIAEEVRRAMQGAAA